MLGSSQRVLVLYMSSWLDAHVDSLKELQVTLTKKQDSAYARQDDAYYNRRSPGQQWLFSVAWLYGTGDSP